MNKVTRSNEWGDGSTGSSSGNPFTFIAGLFRIFFSPFVPILRGVWNATVLALYLPLQLILKLTPAGALVKRLSHQEDAVEHLARQARQLIDHKDITQEERLLICGKRREYAELIAPPVIYPTLYVDVPDDLRRSIVSDGRLVNGDAPATRLAGATITPGFVERAWGASVVVGIKAGYLTFLLGLVLAAAVAFGMSTIRSAADMPTDDSQLSQVRLVMDPFTAAQQYTDTSDRGKSLAG